MGTRHGLTMKERFDLKWIPEPNTGCHLWEASMGSSGYGMFSPTQYCKDKSAHRWALRFDGVEVKKDDFVLHKCNTKLCVNPAHLYVGTHQENIEDSKRAGTFKIAERGSKHLRSKLMEDDVRAIRASDMSQTALARKYGVTQANISTIILRKTWTHI